MGKLDILKTGICDAVGKGRRGGRKLKFSVGVFLLESRNLNLDQLQRKINHQIDMCSLCSLIVQSKQFTSHWILCAVQQLEIFSHVCRTMAHYKYIVHSYLKLLYHGAFLLCVRVCAYMQYVCVFCNTEAPPK